MQGTHKYTQASTKTHDQKNTKKIASPALTFGDDLLHSDLVPPDGEGSANEIAARVTGPGAAAASTSSRTGPGAHQLATGIEELPHGAEATGEGVFVTSITQRQSSSFPPHRLIAPTITQRSHGAPTEPDRIKRVYLQSGNMQ